MATSYIQSIMSDYISFAEQNKIVLLGAPIPRGDGNNRFEYAISFPIRCFYENIQEKYQCPDEKINQMIDKLSNNLISDGYQIDEKILIWVYSPIQQCLPNDMHYFIQKE